MNRLFPFPLYTFFKTAFKNGGFSGQGLLHTPPWLLKTILFEPLRWFELATQSKKIKQHTITEPPVFILGYYRSGTTFLQQLFMQDDRFGYTSAFQMIFPEIMLSCEKWLTPALESVSHLLKIQNPIHRIPFTWYSPGEENVAMATSLSSVGAQWGFFFPKKMSEYFEKYVLFENIPDGKIETWKQTYLFLLKKISLANQKKQLILKSPPNTARIKLMLSLFPDAKFIFVHRNPYEVFASNRRLWKVMVQLYMLGRTNGINYNEIILETYSEIMQRYLQDKNIIPPGHLIEVCYEEFINEPINKMKHIYSSLDLGDFSYCEKKMATFADSQKKYVKLNHKLTEDEMKSISVKWEPFIRYWNYPLL